MKKNCATLYVFRMPEENTPIVVGENFSIVFFEESRLVNQVLDMNIFKEFFFTHA